MLPSAGSAQQREFGLEAGVQASSPRCQACDLLLAAVRGCRTATGSPLTWPSQTMRASPGCQGTSESVAEVADGHVVGAVGLDADAPDRKAGKARAVGQIVVECATGTDLALATPWMSTNCAST